MKRPHRYAHVLIWLILAPLLAAVIYLSVKLRPADPVNPELPAGLAEETG